MSTFPTTQKSNVPDLSIIIPAHNEEKNIGPCLDGLLDLLCDQENIDVELIVIADGCSDGTEDVVRNRMSSHPQVRLVNHLPPCGFGRAIRCGLTFVRGDVVIIYMADLSDSPIDALKYFQTIRDGYDCVYGSRFIPGANVSHYPRLKLIVNRIVNTAIRWMFWTEFNDLTNAFKAYRRHVVESCGPYRSCHFNITLEMSLSGLVFRISNQADPNILGRSNLGVDEFEDAGNGSSVSVHFDDAVLSANTDFRRRSVRTWSLDGGRRGTFRGAKRARMKCETKRCQCGDGFFRTGTEPKAISLIVNADGYSIATANRSMSKARKIDSTD